MKKRWILAALCALLFACSASRAQESFYEEMPQYLQFTQSTHSEKLDEEHTVRRTYPDTANDAVDAQMRELIDEMAERGMAMPAFGGEDAVLLDVGAVISRSGTSVLSFLTLSEVSVGREQTGVEFASRVYDMETGVQLEVKDLFLEGSGVWDVLAEAVREQLSAAFPGHQPDEQALRQLCQADSLMKAPFSLGAARLTLTYRADAVYPGKNTLLHVHIPYAQLRDGMTEYAKQQTNNDRFRMVALTFDDGPAGAYTQRVMDAMRQYGGQATFFVVGKNIAKHPYLIARQQDSLCSVQSHSYTHRYPRELTAEEAFIEKEKMILELGELIGVTPTMMRAPGGNEDFYVRHEIGYPLIHWALTSKDSGNSDYNAIARRVIRWSEDGDIVLMHDLNQYSPKYAARIFEDFSKRGILCVTVEELFLDAGIALEDEHIYYSTYHE